ncbi:MAG TPA: ACP S-malonyltransferase [Acidimicrobiales bacterium]|nr:ACP S-malonyltransferase [Acidimicrobiales bacterium]
MSFSSALAYRDDLVALFPGQGSIAHGAGIPWRESPHWSIVRDVSHASGVDVERLLLEADDEEVIRTDNAQLATLALSLVGFGELLEHGCRPRFYLGHSLGEFSALVAAGVISLEDGARVIRARGRAMASAAENTNGSMVAVMGPSDGAREALESRANLWVANVNGEGQIVVSGTQDALADLLAHHREWGWRRAAALPVGGAFHSPLMSQAQNDLDGALARVSFHASDAVVIANVNGAVPADPSAWRELLSRQLTSPVQLLAATLALPEGVTSSVEMPPGNVLTGLTKRIRPFHQQFAPANRAQVQEIPL